MASNDWSAADDLIQRLQEDPTQFGFYQAMRLIEAAWPEKPRLGKSRLIADDPVRLRQDPLMEFAPSTLAKCSVADDAGTLHISQYFFGLLGPQGPMPLHLTEYAREREFGHKDDTFVRFLDIFHHRLTSLFYRIWADAEPAADLDRPDQARFPTYVGSFLGIGLESYRDRDALSDVAKLYLSGRYSNRTKNPEGLIAILMQLFEIPVELQEFSDEWLELPKNARCFLGTLRGTGILGQDVVIGRRVRECQYRFTLEFGPMGLNDFHSLLPSSSRVQRLQAAVRNYVGEEYGWEYRLVLRKEEVPGVQLGRYGELGWSTWLGQENRPEDADDFRYAPRGTTGSADVNSHALAG